MNKKELPIRSKVEMAKDVAKIVQSLHKGDRRISDALIDNLKFRSIELDDRIQQDVLIFAEEVQFQYDYDPWHKVTYEVKEAADRLIDDLGFHL